MANFTDTQNLDRAETMNGFAGGQTILGRYRLDRVLGQGGMGIVWLARDGKLDRDVALKFLPDIVVNDRASLNDLIRETRRSLELTHPNIVRTYDFVQDSSIAGISMEYVDSDTLRNLRIDQPNGVFEPSQLGEWITQLCSALAYAHTQASIVHRDLKPANLMINGRGYLKVADFGIARSLVESVSHMTQQGGASGTLVYMSPQQLSGDTASASDDIYSLGATLYELFTTRPPFYSGDIPGQVRTKIAPSIAQRRSSLSIPVAEFPSNWEETIAACLAKDPAQRPQSASEVAVRLGLIDAATVPMVRPAPSGPLTATAATAGNFPPPPTSATYSTATVPMTTVDGPAKPNRQKLLLGVGAAAAVLILLVAGLMFNSHAQQERAREEQTRQENAHHEQARLEAEHLANARGTLLVRTEPPGATVKLGDHPPVKTPNAIEDVKLGKQTYEIELDGYDPVTVSTQIEENRTAQPAPVTLTPSKGALQIDSQPEGLTFELRSRANPMDVFTKTTPYTAAALPVGEYDLTVNRAGWPAVKQIVQIRREQPATPKIDFPSGSVTLGSEPPGATVQSEGKDLGVTPLSLDGLPPGTMNYTLQLAGYDKAVASVSVQADKEMSQDTPLHKTAEVSHTRTASTTTHHSSSSGHSNDNNDSGSSHSSSWMRFLPSGGFPNGGPPHPHF